MTTPADKLFEIRKLIASATHDADHARAAVKEAEERLATADVALALGDGDETQVNARHRELQDARANADRHTRRRAALVAAESAALDATRRAATDAQATISAAARDVIAPQLEQLGESFLAAGIEFAARYSLVHGIPPSLVDLHRLLAKLAVGAPLVERLNMRISSLKAEVSDAAA